MIPKEIRDELHWEAGIQLSLIADGTGVSLKVMPTQKGRNLGDLIGMLKYDGEAIPIETLCKPVDVGADWEKSGLLGK